MATKTVNDASLKGLPVGISEIDTVRLNNYYYVDKTPYIKELFKNSGSQVLLIARPRRFGKSLAMDTFYNFLKINPENPGDTSYQEKLFANTKIIKDQEFCQKFMGKFPVISTSFKEVDGKDYHEALCSLAQVIMNTAENFKYLLKSSKLDEHDKKELLKLLDYDYLMSANGIGNIKFSLKKLSKLLQSHYDKRVIVLVDEYDVPLAKAYENGYYDEIAPLIRCLLESTFKDNTALYKGVLTGCLRVSGESIFIGFNNFDVNSVTNDIGVLAECMGFNKGEVRTMLDYYALSEHEDAVKNWYDGYRIGGKEIFCPWDVVCFCKHSKKALQLGNKVTGPKSYWTATSTNNIIEQFMPYLDEREADRMQTLLDGGEIEITVNEKVSYQEISRNHDVNDFWTLLLYTGYLTSISNTPVADDDDKVLSIVRIPNNEIRAAFKSCIADYYSSASVQENSGKFLKALLDGDSVKAEDILNEKLITFVSVKDPQSKVPPENFYHGFLNGIFSNLKISEGIFKSNAEAGNGYADIMYCSRKPRVGIILELKVTSDEDALTDSANAALKQIETKKYASVFARRHVQKVYCYGIAFCRKDCCIQMEVKDF